MTFWVCSPPPPPKRTVEGVGLAGVSGSPTWPKDKKILTVSFLGGADEDHQVVRKATKKWEGYMDLSFSFCDKDGDIRISFDPALGSWSTLGSNCRLRGKDEATMNLGTVQMGTALHEFGHALGLVHEHQRADTPFTWNKEKVIQYLSGPPNNWSPEVIEHNVFRSGGNHMDGTVYDELSIMHYWFPPDYFEEWLDLPQNETLSVGDKMMIQSLFPNQVTMKGRNGKKVLEEEVGRARDLDPFREMLKFIFLFSEKGSFVIEGARVDQVCYILKFFKTVKGGKLTNSVGEVKNFRLSSSTFDGIVDVVVKVEEKSKFCFTYEVEKENN